MINVVAEPCPRWADGHHLFAHVFRRVEQHDTAVSGPTGPESLIPSAGQWIIVAKKCLCGERVAETSPLIVPAAIAPSVSS
jgi:hypothetical protein